MSTLRVRPEAARRFVRQALLLDEPAPDVGTALAHHGYVQIDPINVCGRMHDLMLRNRVVDYREGGLLSHIHCPERAGFEHYLPGSTSVLVAWPRSAWPFLAAPIRERRLRQGRYAERLSRPHERLARHILDEIGARGPLTSDDIEHEERSITGWGTPGRLVKTLLEILLVHGRVLIAGRRGFRRVYDLPERVLPPEVLGAPDRSDEESAQFLVLSRLRQRRLAALSKLELALIGDFVAAVQIEGARGAYVLREDLPRLLGAEDVAPPVAEPLLLAPLDPLIYDRRLTAALWDFEYTWEVYTPPEKRRRGYYALPILAGTRIVGHVDPKIDREAGRLLIVGKEVSRAHRVAPALDQLARFLGVRR